MADVTLCSENSQQPLEGHKFIMMTETCHKSRESSHHRSCRRQWLAGPCRLSRSASVMPWSLRVNWR